MTKGLLFLHERVARLLELQKPPKFMGLRSNDRTTSGSNPGLFIRMGQNMPDLRENQ